MGNYYSPQINEYNSHKGISTLNHDDYSRGSLSYNLNKLPSDRSSNSVYSSSRSWSRFLRRRKQESTVSDAKTIKTYWPVSHTELLFLPEFKIRSQVSENDFNIIDVISRGAFGKVYKVRKTDSDTLYAMKVLQKFQIIESDTVNQVKEEVRIHAVCGHNPFIVSCPYYWQNRKQLFIVTEFVINGELLQMLNKCGPLPEDIVRIYVAELAITLDFLHNAGVIYRDLKPENILLDECGHCQLIDFGLSKWLSLGHRTNTMCGTLQYSAPEILQCEPYTHAVDWWSLGVVACLLLTYQFPTRTGCTVKLPSPNNLTAEAIDLLQRLLEYNPRYRIRSLRTLQTLAFFKKFNFQDVQAKKVNVMKLLNEKTKITNYQLEERMIIEDN